MKTRLPTIIFLSFIFLMGIFLIINFTVKENTTTSSEVVEEEQNVKLNNSVELELKNVSKNEPAFFVNETMINSTHIFVNRTECEENLNSTDSNITTNNTSEYIEDDFSFDNYLKFKLDEELSLTAKENFYLNYSPSSNKFTIYFEVKTNNNLNFVSESNKGIMGLNQPYVLYPTHGNLFITPDDESAGLGISYGIDGIQIFEHSHNYLPCLLSYKYDFGNGWNEVVLKYEKNQAHLFLNGEYVNSSLKSNYKYVFSPNYVGSQNYYGNFEGQVRNIKIYRTAFSNEEIERLFIN